LRRSPFSSNHAPFTPKNNVQASLWLFVSSAQAVRSGDGFQVLQSSLVTASGNSGALLSAVPLPGSGWLFGIGLLGAGVALRLAWRRDSSSPANALPMGA